MTLVVQTDGNTELSQLPESHSLTSSKVFRWSHDTAFGVEEPSTSRSHSHAKKSASSDEELCEKFCQLTCGCTKANGKPCSILIPPEHFADIHAQPSLLDRYQLDCVLTGSLMTTVLKRENVVDGRHKPVNKKTQSCHMHHGYKVCKKTFEFLVWCRSELPASIN